ncbi:cytochrome P450 [Rhizorhabdus dicambivorans]|nr:cytochrome P450 [Rhizorhabdus dicambivorans]
MSASLLIERFDLADPDLQANPFPFYPLLRENHPVLKTAFFGRPCWVLSRRKDVSAVLMDTRGFSSRTTPIDILLFSDPPEHGRLRKMVADHFTRSAVAVRSEQIGRAATELYERCLEKGDCDGIDDFASPLTIRMMSLLLGITEGQAGDVRELSVLLAEAAQARRIGVSPSPEVANASATIADLILGIVSNRSYAPDGVIAPLADRYRAGELTSGQLIEFATLLFVAGHSTTTNLIGNTLYSIAQRPTDLERMRAEAGWIESYIEEVLRTRPSFHRVLRITTRDIELHGVSIPAGSLIMLMLAAANLDSATSESGDAFEPDAKGRAHLAFGQGIHTCLGSWLARLESRIALEVVAARTAALRLSSEDPPTPFVGGTFNEFGFQRLPMTVTRL